MTFSHFGKYLSKLSSMTFSHLQTNSPANNTSINNNSSTTLQQLYILFNNSTYSPTPLISHHYLPTPYICYHQHQGKAFIYGKYMDATLSTASSYHPQLLVKELYTKVLSSWASSYGPSALGCSVTPILQPGTRTVTRAGCTRVSAHRSVCRVGRLFFTVLEIG